jgi:hypothetical protein
MRPVDPIRALAAARLPSAARVAGAACRVDNGEIRCDFVAGQGSDHRLSPGCFVDVSTKRWVCPEIPELHGKPVREINGVRADPSTGQAWAHLGPSIVAPAFASAVSVGARRPAPRTSTTTTSRTKTGVPAARQMATATSSTSTTGRPAAPRSPRTCDPKYGPPVELIDYVRWDKDASGRCFPRKQDPVQAQMDWWWKNQRMQTLADLIRDRWDNTVKREAFGRSGPGKLPAVPAKDFKRWPNRLRELVDQYLRFASSPYVDREILIGAAAEAFVDYVSAGVTPGGGGRPGWFTAQLDSFRGKVANHMREFVDRASAWRVEYAGGKPATEQAKLPGDVVDVYTPNGVLVAQRVRRCDESEVRMGAPEKRIGSPCVTTLANGPRPPYLRERAEFGLPGAMLRVAHEDASGPRHLDVEPMVLLAPGQRPVRARGMAEPRFDVLDEAGRVLESGLPLCDARQPVTRPCIRLPLDGRPLSSTTTIARPGGRQPSSSTSLSASTRITLRPVGARQSNPGGARASLAQLLALHGQR